MATKTLNSSKHPNIHPKVSHPKVSILIHVVNSLRRGRVWGDGERLWGEGWGLGLWPEVSHKKDHFLVGGRIG